MSDKRFADLRDLEIVAKEKTTSMLWNYISHGAGDEQTLQDCTEAFKRFRFLPRILSGGRNLDTKTTVLGQELSLPIGIAPTIWKEEVAPNGEVLAATVAAEAGISYTLSSVSNTLLEDISQAAPDGCNWMQLYLFQDRRIILDIVRRAEHMGYKALVVTCDAPSNAASRHNDDKILFKKYGRVVNIRRAADNLGLQGSDEDCVQFAMQQISSFPSWEEVYWLKSVTSIPIVLKGVISPDAARRCVDAGVSAIIVSAHGGRELDGVPATIEALPLVVKAVRDKGSDMEILFDGGIRSGADIFKALALGAKTVLIGRPIIWGLATSGKAGAKKVVEILANELRSTMILCGCNKISEISPSLIIHQSKL